MKLLPNVNISVPEAADPALIKPVSDALEALDTALGAAPSTLTTMAKTLVGAVNELRADLLDVKTRPVLYNGNISSGESVTLPETVGNYLLLGIVTSDSSGSSSQLGFSLYAPVAGPVHIPVMYGQTSTWMRISNAGTTFYFMSSGNADIKIKTIYGLLKTN